MGIYQRLSGSRFYGIASCGLVATGLALAVVFCSCRDKVVEPNPEPKDYKVYFSSETAGSPMLFTFHTATLAIDSAYIPWGSLGGVTVSATGKRLYINDGISVHVVDASTLSPIAELPYPSRCPVAVSPDDRLVAITGEDLTILRTADYSVVFSDTDVSYQGAFSSDSKTFFCSVGIGPGSVGVVYSVDLSRQPYRVRHKSFSDGSVLQVVPSHNDTKWYLYLSVGSQVAAFEVYDVCTDSVIFRDLVIPGLGQLALTPDNRYVFYTNEGRLIFGPLPPLGFKIYDVLTNSAEQIIDSSWFTIEEGWISVPSYLAVTPDRRSLVMMSGLSSAQVLYLYDIPTGELLYRWIGFPRTFRNLSVMLARS
jgi:hypothetical protein